MTDMDEKKLSPIIVGIGASAGGLEALKSFFGAMPKDCGLAFVVVSHFDPQSKNALPDILRKSTELPVVEIVSGCELTAGQIGICSTSQYVRLDGDVLYCDAPNSEHSSLPVDSFLRTLAEARKEKAICIILSGAGTDGTLGIQAVKGAGGMVMAQDIRTAEFSSMPGSAIGTGLVDYILSPEQMPEHLLQYVRGASNIGSEAHYLHLPDSMEEILSILRQHTGNDFLHYKTNTLARRIERRMNVHHIIQPKHYIRYLHENTHEIDLLFKELLIGVTSFFRDAPVFEILAEQILPQLLDTKNSGDSLRIWVPGCSTGEEAYSLAILLQEYMDAKHKTLNATIFATDLDDKAINHARNGLYPDGIALDITPERLTRFFTREDSHYRVKKSIREMVVFATQNLIQDPPFTKLDMVSCRNLLIYLDAHLQKKVIPLFHYSLKPGGLLLLGSSETVGTFGDLFSSMQTRWKVFGRKEIPLSINRLTKFMELPRIEDKYISLRSQPVQKNKTSDISELAQDLLLKQYVPPL